MSDLVPASRKAIVFVLPAMNPGGAERVLITLMNELKGEEYQKSLISVQGGGALRNMVGSGIEIYEIGKSKNVITTLPRLYKYLKNLRPQIVVSTMAHMNFAVLLMRPLFPKVRFIVREAVTPSYFMDRGLLQRTTIKYAYKFLYPMASVVISPAQAIINEFNSYFKMDISRYALLYNPVDVEKLRSYPITKKTEGLVEFVCAGRLDAQKGFDRLIAALPKLRLQNDWHLTILGEGPQRSELERQVKELGLEKFVSLPGHTAEPWPVIARADAFLMPSRWEGLPNAALEALACGTPVIATAESGGIKEIATYTSGSALHVVNDMDSFIEAVEQVKSNDFDKMRPSLLPELFYKDVVVSRFSALVKKTLSDK